MASSSKHILIATIGSLGDLHPCLALARELKKRRHPVAIASTPFYRDRVEQLGITFHPLRPDWNPTSPEIIRQCEDLKHGPEILFRDLILPHLRDTYADLLTAAAATDFMIAGELLFAAPLVAEKLRRPWASAILSSCSFFSSYDPSVLVNVPWLVHFRKAGPAAYRTALNLCRLATRHWWKPVRDLRHDLGLNPHCDPVFHDKFSPDLVLALFSNCLAQPQPDWPSQTVQPGFIYFDGASLSTTNASELSAFLSAGELPIVFTLGSTAVHNPGNFYSASIVAAKRLRRRAILIGTHSAPPDRDILALPYAPYSQVFPHACAIVHQGGSGTTAQALRAGRPQVTVPYGWDQPDNGERVRRLGAGLCLPRKEYSAESAAAALSQLLSNPGFAGRAAEIGDLVRKQSGLIHACDAIESLLEKSSAVS